MVVVATVVVAGGVVVVEAVASEAMRVRRTAVAGHMGYFGHTVDVRVERDWKVSVAAASVELAAVLHKD